MHVSTFVLHHCLKSRLAESRTKIYPRKNLSIIDADQDQGASLVGSSWVPWPTVHIMETQMLHSLVNEGQGQDLALRDVGNVSKYGNLNSEFQLTASIRGTWN